MKRALIAIAVIAAVTVLFGWILTSNKEKNEEKTAIAAQGIGEVSVDTISVRKVPFSLDFSANGNFEANQDLALLAETPGRVTQILANEGDRVNKGQVLARIDNELLRVDVQTAETNVQKLMRDKERYESSFKTGGVTQQQLDEVTVNLQNARSSLQASRRRMNDANIKAPISGIVNKRHIESGSYLKAGDPLFDLVDISKLKLNITANEAQVVNLKKGDRVLIQSSVFPDEKFAGRISFIAPKADNTLNFPVEIELTENPANRLKAGMYATAIVDFPDQAPVMSIPRGSFIGSVNSNKVFVLAKGNIAEERKVVAGRIMGDQVEILQGLQPGETVITSGQINITGGSKVAPQK